MKLYEAVNSGKPFRRKHQEYYLEFEVQTRIYFSLEDFTADDWEIEEEKVLLSRSQVLTVLKCFKDEAGSYSIDDFELFFKVLGFKE